MSNKEARVTPRAQFRCRVIAIPDGSSDKLPGSALDLSVAGAGILFDVQLKAKTPCTLHFQVMLGGEVTVLSVKAEVVYAVLVGNVSQYRTGFRFTQVTPETQASLRKLTMR